MQTENTTTITRLNFKCRETQDSVARSDASSWTVDVLLHRNRFFKLGRT